MGTKGKALVGQSGGPTAVINQSLVGIIEESCRSGAFDGLLGARHGVQGVMDESFIDLTGYSDEQLELVASTPCAALGSVRLKPKQQECEQMFEVMKKNDVHTFFYIGGNDTAETAQILSSVAADANYDLHVFHVPKTIDNDLKVTDHCPGYGSAAKFVALAFMGDNEDNRSLPGIKIDVVMGRHAGFLTAASVLGKRAEEDGPHLVYVPEVSFSREQFIADVSAINSEHGRCLVAVSEGIHTEDGTLIGATGEKDTHGNAQLSGSGSLGDLLASWVRESVAPPSGSKLRVRADTFGYLQRSFPSIVSRIDAVEAREVGRAAVRAVSDVDKGSIVIRRTGEGDNYDFETFVTPLETVAKLTKSMERTDINEAGNYMTRDFIDYAAPLAGPLPVPGRL